MLQIYVEKSDTPNLLTIIKNKRSFSELKKNSNHVDHVVTDNKQYKKIT